MNLRLNILCFIIGIYSYSSGQIPQGYYNDATGKTGFELKTALHIIISTNHTPQSYSSLWNHFVNTDKKSNGKVWDIYSDNPGGSLPYEYTFITDQCGNVGPEGTCYNREHSVPQSWFGGVAPAYTDLFHIYPTDGQVNGMRDNYPYGEVMAPTRVSLNGSKLGLNSTTGYSGTVFEPIDAYKGDLARTYFYMATRYENVIANWDKLSSQGDVVLNGTSNQVFEQWALNLLLKWHQQDPVSQKETDRNNAIYNIQKNRNPFIDFPHLVECIWLNQCNPNSIITQSESATIHLYQNKQEKTITVTWNNNETTSVSIYDLSGRCVAVYKNALSGLSISTGHLNKGYYIVEVLFDDDTRQTQKMIN